MCTDEVIAGQGQLDSTQLAPDGKYDSCFVDKDIPKEMGTSKPSQLHFSAVTGVNGTR